MAPCDCFLEPVIFDDEDPKETVYPKRFGFQENGGKLWCCGSRGSHFVRVVQGIHVDWFIVVVLLSRHSLC